MHLLIAACLRRRSLRVLSFSLRSTLIAQVNRTKHKLFTHKKCHAVNFNSQAAQRIALIRISTPRPMSQNASLPLNNNKTKPPSSAEVSGYQNPCYRRSITAQSQFTTSGYLRCSFKVPIRHRKESSKGSQRLSIGIIVRCELKYSAVTPLNQAGQDDTRLPPALQNTPFMLLVILPDSLCRRVCASIKVLRSPRQPTCLYFQEIRHSTPLRFFNIDSLNSFRYSKLQSQIIQK